MRAVRLLDNAGSNKPWLKGGSRSFMQRKLVIFAIVSSAIALLAVLVGAVVRILVYEPPLVPAPGYSGFWATEPDTFGASAAKSWAVISENRPCEYVLLGWTTENVLYIRETCVEEVYTLVIDPRTGESIVNSPGVPEPELTGRAIPQVDAVELVRSVGTRPVSAESYMRAIKVRGDAIGSLDGVYVAMVVRYIYGPEDVLVVWPSDITR